jgi:hypothetical protein
MAVEREVVFGEVVETGRLPDWASTGVFIIEWLQRRGLWDEATVLLQIQREGGYAGIDALLLLLYYFSSGQRVGLKEFCEEARCKHAELAAVGGRKRLPTQASLSRLLTAVDADLARDFGCWLLRTAVDIRSVLNHPSVLTRDAMGEGWHIFDWDPTVSTLRHRALPVVEGTPDGRRRSESLAKPGYTGRKRGDVQFSRATLQHSGSGLWLAIELAPGNGQLRAAFQSAIRQAVATCEVAGVAQARTILRADGVGGNVPFITACVEGGVHYITRLAHYQLLQDEDVVGHLNEEAAWFEVPCSGSGPSREASDLGRVVIEPAADTVREDGSPFEPIETRVIVSRFPSSNNGRGAGVVLEGWQYELYATDLAPDAWPEAEIVAGYYGRSGQENRFAQEDRELGLDRIFSYHLPGQLLATLVGLFVWNFHICRGMELASPAEQLPEQPLRNSPPLAQGPRLPEVDAGDDSSRRPAYVEPSAELDSASIQDAKRESSCTAPPSSADSSAFDSAVRMRRGVIEALDELDWEQLLHRYDDWQWLADKGSLRCPAEALLQLMRVEETKGAGIRARFKADSGTCDDCSRRHRCIGSDDPHYRKDVRLLLPLPSAKKLREMWLQVPKRRRWLARSPEESSTRSRSRPIWRKKPLSWRPPNPSVTAPRFSVMPPALLPAELRRMTRATIRPIEVHVRFELPEIRPPKPLVLAYSAAERQNRRLSWVERLRWNDLPEGSSVQIRLLGAGPAEGMLTHKPNSSESRRSAGG